MWTSLVGCSPLRTLFPTSSTDVPNIIAYILDPYESVSLKMCYDMRIFNENGYSFCKREIVPWLYVGFDGAASLLQKFENFKRLLGTIPSGPSNNGE